ncbi:MAG TPA: hypothetical protein VMP89_19435 [Solirubrobacteraceae bacterium]|nr:hypothetical protein [Solirubrobacteraceae bacterium]
MAIDCLPRATRLAMLEAIGSNEIIAGAYTGPHGICPMLAAHRAGGRTNAISFARAWDRFAFRGARVMGPRRATARELLVLRSLLEASLLTEDAPDGDLGAAIASHQRLVAARATRPERPGDPDRSRELAGTPGWAWTRVARSYDEYNATLERLQAQLCPPAEPEQTFQHA